MRKLIICILALIAVASVSCTNNRENKGGESNEKVEETNSNQNEFVPDISFDKDNKQASICNVNIQLDNGENKRIEYFEYSDLTNREDLLCKNLSELDEFSFIDSLPPPKEFGTLVKQYSVLDSYTEITNPVSYESSFIKYFLFKNDKGYSVVREHWIHDGFNGECDSKAQEVYSVSQSTENAERNLNNNTNPKSIENANEFQGQKLKNGERVIKITWGMENKTQLNTDIGNNPRFASKPLIVPQGKKWILLYFNEDFIFESGTIVSIIPYLFIDNKEEKFYDRYYSKQSNIHLSKARDGNLKFYSGSNIKAISTRYQGKGLGDNFKDYKGEMWVLEVNE